MAKDDAVKAVNRARERDGASKLSEGAMMEAEETRAVLDTAIAKELGLLGEEEGLEFIASEVGLESATLPPIAKEVAALFGHQKLALQMVGSMNCPISRKRTARSWEELRELALELRAAEGLTDCP